MVDINTIRQNTYSCNDLDVWEEYIDAKIKNASEQGYCIIYIEKDYNGIPLKNADDLHFMYIHTTASMYKNAGFNVKVKKKRNTIKYIKISW